MRADIDEFIAPNIIAQFIENVYCFQVFGRKLKDS